MARSLFLLLSCVAVAALVVGCSSEAVDGNDSGSSSPTAAAGDSKTGTVNQLSINPDYK